MSPAIVCGPGEPTPEELEVVEAFAEWLRGVRKFRSHTGLVHLQRHRFFVGTAHERPAPRLRFGPYLMCGHRYGENILVEVDMAAEVTCGMCRKAANTGAHRP